MFSELLSFSASICEANASVPVTILLPEISGDSCH